jgi:hypothetical protein
MPVLALEIGLGFKKDEERQVNSHQLNLIPTTSPERKLRVLKILGNDIARANQLKIHHNMQVPAGSLLHRFFYKQNGVVEDDAKGIENLNMWRHSGGKSLGNFDVEIQARRVQDSVIALVSLLNS